MKRTRWLIAAAIVPAAAAVMLTMPKATQSAHLGLVSHTSGTEATASPAGWTKYSLPVSGNAAIYGISAPGRNDAWAIGATFSTGKAARAYVGAARNTAVLPRDAVLPGDNTGSSGCTPFSDGTLLMHWNGTKWARVAVPQVGDPGTVIATGPNDVWISALCESLHWNGKAWTSAPYAPVPDMQDFSLSGFSVDGPRDAWLTGTELEQSGSTGYVERWNGARWQRVTLPSAADSSLLSGVDALGPDNVWVVGSDANLQPILLHWNGRSWTRVPAPATGYRMAEPLAVQTVAGNVWTVGNGSRELAPNIIREPLIIRWNGQRWENTATPAPPYHSETYTIADDRGQLWAAGDTFTPGADSYGMALLRWTGSRWVASPPPAPATEQGGINQLAAIPGGGLWSVGYTDDANGLPLPVIARQ